ncbi:MAG: glucose-1-phosphate cytidylyltransferase [Desulfobacterales bacterium]|jgi:glucose-1-phosphate cytidylyltransferase|nr:glucose-1-phosphate cytidylyltransferase [Desulfobacterales bacterium]
MKAVILAGGYGTRISEETGVRPKPMVTIGEKPILWHIMKIYSAHGVNDFIICLGYKGYAIKEFFATYSLQMSDVTYDFRKNRTEFHQENTEPWRVTLIETGIDTMTGGRIKRVKPYIGSEAFCLTYGDGLSDVNISELVQFHKVQKRLATLTAVQPPGRFGAFTLDREESHIKSFKEKPKGDGAWINGGFFVLEPDVFDFIQNDSTVWEQSPMEKLAQEGQLSAFRHQGFWQPMDTLRDKNLLEKLWQSGTAPWKIW